MYLYIYLFIYLFKWFFNIQLFQFNYSNFHQVFYSSVIYCKFLIKCGSILSILICHFPSLVRIIFSQWQIFIPTGVVLLIILFLLSFCGYKLWYANTHNVSVFKILN